MVDIEKLQLALPVCRLQPQEMAHLCGFSLQHGEDDWKWSFFLLEPPAGQKFAYLDPFRAMRALLWKPVADPDWVERSAAEIPRALVRNTADQRRVHYYDYSHHESPVCIPVSDFVTQLRGQAHIASTAALDFIEAAELETIQSCKFDDADFDRVPRTLMTLPTLPWPKAMIEFVPAYPWSFYESDGAKEWVGQELFLRWREDIRSVAAAIEKRWGMSPYRFVDPAVDYDDDDVHRFLVLDWCCHFMPSSPFVAYLVQRSGAASVEELRSALRDPESYFHPFEMHPTWATGDADRLRFDFRTFG